MTQPLFIHIQKTGGSSVRAALQLSLEDPMKHWTASEVRDKIGNDAWGERFSFAFVRNPWDRLVSWWSDIEKFRTAWSAGGSVNNFQRYILKSARTFGEFLECGATVQDADGVKCIWKNQSDYLQDANGGTIVSFIGRFENIDRDFQTVCHRTGLRSLPLPRQNASVRQHYSQYYTPAQAAVVAERYQRDIEAFGYSFAGAPYR